MGGWRSDKAIAWERLCAVEPTTVEASLQAERRNDVQAKDRRIEAQELKPAILETIRLLWIGGIMRGWGI